MDANTESVIGEKIDSSVCTKQTAIPINKQAEKTIIFMNQLPRFTRQTMMSSFLFVFDNLISLSGVSNLIQNFQVFILKH